MDRLIRSNSLIKSSSINIGKRRDFAKMNRVNIFFALEGIFFAETFSIFLESTLHTYSKIEYEMTHIHPFKNLSTIHNFLPCYICHNFRSSVYCLY